MEEQKSEQEWLKENVNYLMAKSDADWTNRRLIRAM